MPLSQSPSKEAFSDNVAAEVNAGRPQKQAVAIAYSVKRKNGGKDTGASKGRKRSLKADVKEHMEKLKKGLRT
jgi:hypothetical protein